MFLYTPGTEWNPECQRHKFNLVFILRQNWFAHPVVPLMDAVSTLQSWQGCFETTDVFCRRDSLEFPRIFDSRKVKRQRQPWRRTQNFNFPSVKISFWDGCDKVGVERERKLLFWATKAFHLHWVRENSVKGLQAAFLWHHKTWAEQCFGLYTMPSKKGVVCGNTCGWWLTSFCTACSLYRHLNKRSQRVGLQTLLHGGSGGMESVPLFFLQGESGSLMQEATAEHQLQKRIGVLCTLEWNLEHSLCCARQRTSTMCTTGRPPPCTKNYKY